VGVESDRQALERVRDEVQKWKRYAITVKPEDAELLIAVRTGRLALAGGGFETGRQDGSKISGPIYGAEVSSPDDMLEVYESHDGHEGMLLWRNMQKGGLSGSPPPLFDQLREGRRIDPSAPGLKSQSPIIPFHGTWSNILRCRSGI
jgi:hypothetical protein